MSSYEVTGPKSVVGRSLRTADRPRVPRGIRLIAAEIATVMVGKEDHLEQLTIALLIRGHVLREGIPGVAKTTLSNLFVRSTGEYLGQAVASCDTDTDAEHRHRFGSAYYFLPSVIRGRPPEMRYRCGRFARRTVVFQ